MEKKAVVILIGFAAALLLVHLGYYLSLWMAPDTYWPSFVYLCVFAPLWEEAVFRWAPLEIARRTNTLDKIKWPLIILTSAVFGLIHNGTLSIPVQGVLGIILSLVYIESGFSYLSCVLIHSMWNASIFIGLIGE